MKGDKNLHALDWLVSDIRQRHQESGRTLKQLAIDSGVNEQRLWGFYTTGWNPTLNTLRKLSAPYKLQNTKPQQQPTQVSPDEALVEGLSRSYLDRWCYPRIKSARQRELTIRREILPLWAGRKVASITTRDVLVMIDAITDRGTPAAANEVFSCLNQMFLFAIRRGVLENNPCAGMQRPHVPRPSQRILSSDELRDIWFELGNYASRTIHDALCLQLVTAQRISEVIGMSRDELDLDARLWRIPAERSKSGNPHIVPLSDLATEVVDRRLQTGKEWLFQSRFRPQPIHLGAIAVGIHLATGRGWPNHFTSRDLRRTAATTMARLGVARVTLEKILNHSDNRAIGAYDWHTYDHEKRDALNLLASHFRTLFASR